jgi:16S rRNA (guanine527-N7)-methyltransferase
LNLAEDGSAEHLRLQSVLIASAHALQVELSSDQGTRLLDFVDLLFRWNRTYNLTAIRDPFAILIHHVLDCLAAVPPLRRELGSRAGRRVLDVGSGGGLPGLIFALLLPQVSFTCVDSVGKKTAFVRQAAASMRLGNVEVVHERVESMVGGFDIITSRAFASLADFTRLTFGLLNPEGAWMAMKGKAPNEEISELAQSVRTFHVEPLRVPNLEADRCLVWMNKISSSLQ